MKKVLKLLRLPLTDKRLLARSVFWLVAVRLGLCVLPFQTLRRLLAKMKRATRAQSPNQPSVSKVSWAVTVAGIYIPFVRNCLTKALAAQLLLGQHGHATTLRIGVARSEDGDLTAHAWVEVDGRIVIGGSESILRFVPLPPLEE